MLGMCCSFFYTISSCHNLDNLFSCLKGFIGNVLYFKKSVIDYLPYLGIFISGKVFRLCVLMSTKFSWKRIVFLLTLSPLSASGKDWGVQTHHVS